MQKLNDCNVLFELISAREYECVGKVRLWIYVGETLFNYYTVRPETYSEAVTCIIAVTCGRS